MDLRILCFSGSGEKSERTVMRKMFLEKPPAIQAASTKGRITPGR